MSRQTYRMSAPLFLAVVVVTLILGVGRGIGLAAPKQEPNAPPVTQEQLAADAAAADQIAAMRNPDGSPRNLLDEMQDKLAAKRAAAGMMRGVTNTMRWEAAKRHADRRAADVRGKAAGHRAQPPGQEGGAQ